MRNGWNRWIKVLSAFLIVTLLPAPGSAALPGKASAEPASILQSGDGGEPPYLDAANVKKVESETLNTYILLHDGTVWAWGNNGHGQLGNGSTDSEPRYFPEPVSIAGNPFIEDIAAGRSFVLALDADGNVWQWGCIYFFDYGECPEGALRTIPEQVQLDGKVIAISAGLGLAMALTEDGEVWTWGARKLAGWGSLSDNADFSDFDLTPRPVVVDPNGAILQEVEQIAGGHQHALALSNGTVYVWGAGSAVGLPGSGYSTQVSVATPLEMPPATKIITASYADASVVLTSDGVYGWTSIKSSLGFGYSSNVDVQVPVKIGFLEDLTEIALTSGYVLGLKHDNMVYKTNNEEDVILATNLEGVYRIFAGPYQIFMATADRVQTAGNHYYGSDAFNLLGNGVIDYKTPESDPLPVLAFDAPPPVVKSYSMWKEGNRFSIEMNLHLGRYDTLYISVYEKWNDDSLVWMNTEAIRPKSNIDNKYRYYTPFLEPGKNYQVEIYSHDSYWNKASEKMILPLQIPALEHTIYLYGAPENFELKIRLDGQDVSYQKFPGGEGKHYDKIVFTAVPDQFYDLESGTAGYRLSESEIIVRDANDETASASVVRVIPASEPDVLDWISLVDGKLQGEMNVRSNPEALGYLFYFIDADGKKIGDGMELTWADFEGGYWFYYFEDEDVPTGSVYLQLYMVDEQGEEAATHIKLWLESLQFPEITINDLDAEPGALDLQMTFHAFGGQHRIDFYKIVKEDRYGELGTIAFIPSDNPNPPDLLPKISLDPSERLVLYLVSNEGLTSMTSTVLPVVDNMADQSGLIDYDALGLYEISDEIAAPQADQISNLVDVDPRGGYVEGFVSWAPPTDYEYASFLYDLYYRDKNGNLTGLARVWQPEFRFWAGSRLPKDAGELVVVLIMNDASSVYQPDWLQLELQDTVDASGVLRKAYGLNADESLSLTHVAKFVLDQLVSDDPVDVTGDWQFDSDDVRALLESLSE